MTVVARAFVLLLCFLVLPILSGCDSGRSTKVEILSGPAPGKTLIRVAVSDEAYGHFMKVADSYSLKRNVQFDVSSTQGKNIPGLLGKKTVDIGVTARRPSAETIGANLSYIPYAYDGAVFLVSSDVRVRSLSLAQVRQIYQGTITNWREVGGEDQPIRVIDRPPYSAVRISIGGALFDGELPVSGSSLVMETNENMYHALKTVPSHIAFAPISRVSLEHFPSVPLIVDGKPPLITNVPSERYPSTIEYAILIPREAAKEATDLAAYMQSVEGMHVLASLALVPASGKLSLSSCHCRETEGTFSPSRGSSLAGTFSIAVVPELGAIQQENRYSGISRVIADEMGVRTQLKHLETYERVIREFEEGRIDAAFVGSLVYAQLHERVGVEPLARPDSDNVSHYQGLIIVRSGSGIRNFAGLKGKSFAYVPNTSAGELFTLLMLKMQGFAGGQGFFSRVVKVSTHSDAVQMVMEGKVDGAAVKNLVLQRMTADRGKRGAAGIKEGIGIIESSPLFPENALVVSPSLDRKQAEKLRSIVLSMGEKESGREALRTMGVKRFIPTQHSDYSHLYEMAKEAGYTFRKR